MLYYNPQTCQKTPWRNCYTFKCQVFYSKYFDLNGTFPFLTLTSQRHLNSTSFSIFLNPKYISKVGHRKDKEKYGGRNTKFDAILH